MKTTNPARSLTNFASWAETLLDTGKDALHRNERHRSDHLGPFRKSVLKWSGATVLSLAFGGFAIVSLLQLEKSAKRHQQWKKLDAQLEDALSESLDARDAVAKY